MKTKIFFLMLIFISLSWISRASVVHVYLNEFYVNEYHYFCNVDSIIVHKPTNAMTNIKWTTPDYNPIWGDSVVIVTSSNVGIWHFRSLEVEKDFYVYILSSGPTEPFAYTILDTCGVLHSQLGAQPGTTYLWSTGATSEEINTGDLVGNFPMEIWVTVSNACGSITDGITVNWTGPTPNLGPDATVCYSTVLTPGSFSNYLWSGGSTQSTLNVSVSGTYSVTVTNTNGCKTNDAVYIHVDTARDMQMCDVSYDTLTNKNSINWFVDPLETEITSVNIWVKNQMGVFVALGTVPYTQGSYIDMGSNPHADYNEYYVTAISNCGEGNPSQIHRSIWLTTLTNELQWQNYYGNFMPLYYIVFAKMINNSIVPIDTVPSCSGSGCLNHSAIVPDPNIVKYFVAFEYTCSNNKTTGWVRSHYLNQVLTPVQEVMLPIEETFSVYPNPATDKLNITINSSDFTVELFTLFGQVVLSERNTKALDVSTLPKGVYIIGITANGIKNYQKVVID